MPHLFHSLLLLLLLNTKEGVSLSVYPTEGSGKTCTKIKETAHTLGGYTGCEPTKAAHSKFPPRRERVHIHLLYVSSLPDFSVQMKAKRFLLCLSLISERHRKYKNYLAKTFCVSRYFLQKQFFFSN